MNVHNAPDLKPDAKTPICASFDLESGRMEVVDGGLYKHPEIIAADNPSL